jgi:hypothetical protein
LQCEYLRGHSHCFLFAPTASCPPVSRRAPLCFGHHRSPWAAWLTTSPPLCTGHGAPLYPGAASRAAEAASPSAEHRRAVIPPVSCRPDAAPFFLCESRPSCCQAGALRVKQAINGHRVTGWAASARHRPCHRSSPTRSLSSCAARRAGPGLCGRSAMGRPSAVWAVHRPGHASTVVMLGMLMGCAPRFRPIGTRENKILFSFSF